MEGLIPTVYRSMKRNKTLRQYQSMSSQHAAAGAGAGAGAGASQGYNISDFYPEGYNYQYVTTPTPSQLVVEMTTHPASQIQYGQRRSKSFSSNQYKSSNGRGGGGGFDDVESKQLVRFRSQRLFSCVTGE